MTEQAKKTVRDRDQIYAFCSGLIAAIVMSYVASVAKPGIIDLVLTLVGLGAIVLAFMLVARSSIDAAGKAATVVGTGVAGGLCLFGLSMLLGGERQTAAPAIAAQPMPTSFDYVLGGVVVIGLLIYLTYALLRPERF
jgi:K+-transporting ATPase KdpF subunit